MDLFESRAVEKGLLQAVYLLETLRRLLVDGNTRMDMHGLCVCKTYLTVGLIERFGHAFGVAVKLLHSSTCQDRELVLRSLEEIFEILCFQKAFESPVVLCAAYIALLKNRPSLQETTKGTKRVRVDSCFGGMVSTLNSVGYDFVLQEMLATGLEDVEALAALGIALDNCPDGANLPLATLMIVEDISFTIAKLLFGLTRNILTTSSSEVFVAQLKLILKILQEKVTLLQFNSDSQPKAVSKWNLDHLIANLTVACSPACPHLQGSATPDDIFDSIGSVTLSLLQLYHRRLSSKYHLLVRLLQTILHLFILTTPLAPRPLRTTLSRPPPWLISPCTVPSAKLFSRILTMWADPPSTLWRSESKRQKMTSNVAKTGKAVSKHVPWFMMEYVALLAEYPELVIEQGVQKALAEGVYALFGVLGTYEREMCMAALDGSGRGIFKNLWEEWNKFGRFVEQ